ncbi:Peptidase S1 domain-containing protein [Caenorhabditis elegans]|uniref:Peptidase S1 domain-containing protein n=1 Tax=Caenorhabditis elegans TaxID=6239 RepID=O01566_CAEEL|nr:Peptidase S1 domain-containing protein [Caenorhabditis elegans]CCD68505.3 Peptidase S1 domain-containing protein [Caenorhabditis elegans]
MRWLQSIVTICLIVFVDSRKLTAEENEKRLEDCGKNVKSKIFNGRKAEIDEAPWAVRINTYTNVKNIDETWSKHCSGTLTSPRHILTATHCAATYTETEWNGTVIDAPIYRKYCEEQSTLIVREVAASRIVVRLRNRTEIGRAKYLFMFNYCRKIVDKNAYEIQYPDDIMIIELSEDVEYSSELKPVCVAGNTDDNAPNSHLDLFGFGDDPPRDKPSSLKNLHDIPLKHHKVEIMDMNKEGTSKRMDPRLFIAKSVTRTSVACPGDSGAGGVKEIDKRTTVVGVFTKTTCKFVYRDKRDEETYASFGFYANDVCEYTGICTTSGSFSSLKYQITVLFLFYYFI